MWLVATILDRAKCWIGLYFNMNKIYGSGLNSGSAGDKIWRAVVGYMNLKIKVKAVEIQMWESVVCGSETLISLFIP